MGKPTATPKSLVCSECGLSWEAHTKGRKTAPTLDVCVRLLKAELAKPRGVWPGVVQTGTYGNPSTFRIGNAS